ncbi:MAG: LPS translocon maturation chaperone LptM [Pseudohongiellaceae bacterium]
MRPLAALVIVSCLLLGGCGQKGPLVPPPPASLADGSAEP